MTPAQAYRAALAAAAKVAEDHALRWQTLATEELDKANDAHADADHVWRRDAHHHHSMAGVALNVSACILGLPVPADVQGDASLQAPSTVQAAANSAANSRGAVVDEPAREPVCATCGGSGRLMDSGPPDHWSAPCPDCSGAKPKEK